MAEGRSNYSPTITSGYPWGKNGSRSNDDRNLVEKDNPIVARLFGPKGELIWFKRARSTVPFGFQSGR